MDFEQNKVAEIFGTNLDFENWRLFDDVVYTENLEIETDLSSAEDVVIPDALKSYNQIDEFIQYFKNTLCFDEERYMKIAKKTLMKHLNYN